MMEHTHTPGPWQWAMGAHYADIVRTDKTSEDLKDQLIASLDPDRSRAELIANCYLVAAAPDMLATLRDIVQMLTDVNDMRPAALRAAREAIVRATGGQS